MKKIRLLMISLAALLLTAGFQAQAQSLSDVVAAGKKVYVEIVDLYEGTENAFPGDEKVDLAMGVVEGGDWVKADSPKDADFIMRVEVRKHRVNFGPRTTLTPSVRLKDGTVLWTGKSVDGNAALVNGYRSTDAAISTMVKKDFEKDLFKKAGR